MLRLVAGTVRLLTFVHSFLPTQLFAVNIPHQPTVSCQTCSSDSLDALILLPVTQVLPTRQMLQWSHEPLRCRHRAQRSRQGGLRTGSFALMLTIVQAHIVILRFPSVFTGIEHFLEEGDLGCCGGKDEIRHGVKTVQLGDDFKCISLELSATGYFRVKELDLPDR